MALGALGDDPARALLAVAAVVADPGLAQHLPAEAAVPLLALPAVAGVGLAPLDVEGVRRRPQADDRPARLDVVDDVLHLVVGQVAEAGEEDHQVGRLERLQAGDVVATVGVDRPVLVDREQHRALEAVMLREDLRQLRQRLLRAVLLVAADQHDVLPLAGPVAPGQSDPAVIGPREAGQEAARGHGHPETRMSGKSRLRHDRPPRRREQEQFGFVGLSLASYRRPPGVRSHRQGHRPEKGRPLSSRARPRW